MSDAHNDHQSLIRTPKQLVIAVAGFFLVIVIGIILLVSFVTNTKLTGAGSDSQSVAAVAARLRPVAEEGFTLRDANAPKILQSAEAVYTAVCAACHATGAAGAPKVGDAAWAPRLAKGYDVLVKHAIEGFNAMPAKGGNPDLDDVEVARAVVHMANQSGAKFSEPTVSPTPAKVSADAAVAPPSLPAVASPVLAPSAANAASPTATAAATPTSLSADAGKKVFDITCVACHGAGIAGAPKLADKAAWTPRIQQGASVLYEHALKGFQGKAGVMPPKGGAVVSDAEVKAAVDYMVAAAK